MSSFIQLTSALGGRLSLALAIAIAVSSCVPPTPAPDVPLAAAYGREPWPVEQTIDRNVRMVSKSIENTLAHLGVANR